MIYLDLASTDTHLERQQVFSSLSPFQLAVSLRPTISHFFSAHTTPKRLADQKELWCLYTADSTGARLRVRAQASEDRERVWCDDVPRDPGNYSVALSYDGLNQLDVPDVLRVHSPFEVAVTDVGPRLLPLLERAASLQRLTIQLHGRSLHLLDPRLVAVFLDGLAIPAGDFDFEAEEHLLTLRLPRYPQSLLRIQLLARVDSNETLADVHVRTVAEPTIWPQAQRVYPGEDIRLSGENLADQLDLICTLGERTAKATVLDSSALLCPSVLLEPQHGPGPKGLRSIQVRS